MIKPEFWQSKTLRKCSLESRLLFIGLWNFCDDYGVCLNSNRKILGEIFPFDENISEKRLEKWKNELIDNKLLIPVESDSTKYLIVRSWFEHQIVPNPSKRRYLEDDTQEYLMNAYLDSNESLNNSQLSKEKEKEKEKEKVLSSSLDPVVLQWNSFAKENNLATIVSLSEKRKKGIKNRALEEAFNLDNIFSEIKNSKFLLGKNDRGWKVDFDFVFCSSNNYLKILEGKYRTNGTNRDKGRGSIDIDKYREEAIASGEG